MGKAKAPRVFVPLYKVDEEQRLVYGRITAEEVDQSGEVMDYASSKPNFEKWSNDIHTASGGLSKGNVRVMHGLAVAGKLTELEFNDDDQSIEVCSKIVDDGEWQKVLEGCYTGFSVGGRYGKRWTDKVDGESIKKFTAIPNEVSIVDNPCVKSATFSLIKADGAEEQIAFHLEGDDDTSAAVTEPTTVEVTGAEPSNDAVVAKAADLAKAAGDGTTWMDHIHNARTELMKADGTEPEADDGDPVVEEPTDEPKVTEDPEGEAVEKTTPAGVVQTWKTSDGQTFEKKADAVAHEEELAKANAPKSEAEKLRERMAKALSPESDAAVVVDLMEDYDRLGKAWNALKTPFGEDGKPVLEKGMYTVERFARILWDLGKLTKSISAEGANEGDDGNDKQVAADIKKAMGDLGDSFKVYVADQITELLAGIDDEAYVCYYDYYYAAAKDNGEDQLAKDVCSLLDANKDASREKRETMGETLVKAFGLVLGSNEETTDDLSPTMQKRFDELQQTAEEFKKVAEDAVGQIETLTKRIETVENTPMPRAPNPANVALRAGDNGPVELLGKTYSNRDELAVELHNMLKTEGPDAMAMMMIKAAQAGGGQTLSLSQR